MLPLAELKEQLLKNEEENCCRKQLSGEVVAIRFLIRGILTDFRTNAETGTQSVLLDEGSMEVISPCPVRKIKKQERKPQEEESKRNTGERLADPDCDLDSSEDSPLSGRCARADCQHYGELVTLLEDADWDPAVEMVPRKSAKWNIGSSAVDDKKL